MEITFEKNEIFSTYYLSYVRGYEAAIRGGNNISKYAENAMSRKTADKNFSIILHVFITLIHCLIANLKLAY